MSLRGLNIFTKLYFINIKEKLMFDVSTLFACDAIMRQMRDELIMSFVALKI